MIKRMLLSMAIAGTGLAVCAEMVHEGPDQYNLHRNRDGIVTRFWNNGACIGKLTNWFGSCSALLSEGTLLQYLYNNQVTYDDASGEWFWQDWDGTWMTETTGYVPAGVLWGHTFHMRSYWQSDRESAFAGYRTKDSDEILHPYDRATNTISDVYAVWKAVPRWHDDRQTLNIQRNRSYLTDYFWCLTPTRKEDSQTCWSTDVPVINAVFYVQFPAWIEWVMNGDTEVAIEHHPVDSVDCEVTLVICSTSAENDWLGKTVPRPGTEYYKKIKTRATARYQGIDLYEAWTRMEISCSPGERLPEGTYRFWIEVNSDRSIAESAYDDNGYSGVFTVSDDSLNVDVAPFACDWVNGDLMLHWRIADSEGMSDEESNSIIDLKNKRFNVWRSAGKGWDDFSNAELVGHRVSGAYWTDNDFGEIPGVEPVKYWVQILTGKEIDTRARPSSPPSASCVTRRRFGLAIGVGTFDPNGNTVKVAPEISHPAQDISLFKQLFERTYGNYGGKYYQCMDSKATVGAIKPAFETIRYNADSSPNALPGDILIMYMAMHGEEGRLVLYDDFYSMNQLHEDLKVLDKESGIKVIAMLMACHSESLTEATAVRDDTMSISNWFDNVAWICSCRKNQNSTAIEKDELSLFGRSLLDFGWNLGNADTSMIVNKAGGPFGRVLPDGKQDGTLTFLELAQYARNLAVGCSSKYKSSVTITGDSLLQKTAVGNVIPSAPPIPIAPTRLEGKCVNGAVFLSWPRDVNVGFYCVYYRKVGDNVWTHYRLVNTGDFPFVLSGFDNTRDAVAGIVPRLLNRVTDLWDGPHWFESDTCYVPLDYGEIYEFKVAGVNASGVGPTSYTIRGLVRDLQDEILFERVLEYSGNMQMNSGESNGTLDVRVAVKDGYTATSAPSSDGVPVEIVATYKRNGEDSIYIGEATICSNAICTVALDGQDGTLNLEMLSMGILATLGEATAACLRSDDSGTFEIDSESLKQKSAFVESDVSAREGTNVTVVVVGGDEGNASNVKLYLMYNTATVADLDLAQGTVDGVTPKGGLKFPLMLMWEKGEIGEKVISMPIKKDALVEGNEFFTLQLADAQGMALGDECVCTVTIEDVDSSVQTKNDVVISQGVSIAKEGSDAWFVVDSETGDLNSDRSVKLRSPLLSANDGSVSLSLNGIKGQGLLRVAYRFVGVTGAEESDKRATFCIMDGKDVVYEIDNRSAGNDWNVADVLLAGNGMHAIKMSFSSCSDKKVGLEICGIRWALRDQTGHYKSEHYIFRECSPNSAGTIQGGGYYLNGAKATLVATAKPGWAFIEWRNAKTGDMVTRNTKLSITVDDSASYVAVFEQIPYIRGLADPADGGKVSGSGLCARGKKVTLKATANKNFTFLGWRQAYPSGLAATSPVSGEEPFVATTASLVIDRSAKPAASTKTTTTITDIDGDVTYYAVFKSDPMVTVLVEATDGKGDALIGKGAGKYVAGTITGEGKYAPGKTKIALKAAVNKGYVFAGWYAYPSGLAATSPVSGEESDAQGAGCLSQAASYMIDKMPSNDVEYVAKFVTADEDKASIELAVNGEAVGRDDLIAPRQTNVWCGVYLEWPVAADALSATTIKVSGLPAGLKFVDKPVTTKVGTGAAAVVVTNVPANTIYGAPTAVSKTRRDGVIAPYQVVFTVTTAGKSTQTFAINLYIDPLPDWAVGTFDGAVRSYPSGLAATSPVSGEELAGTSGEELAGTSGEELAGTSGEEPCGTVSLTVDAKGKISGKALGDGLTYTLAAPYYAGFAVVDGGEGLSSNFLADVTASWSYKEGSKTIKTNDVVQMAVQDNGIGGYAAVEGWFEAYTVNWKVDPWKTLGKSFDKKVQVYAIRVDGTFIDGDDAATVALDADVTGRVTLKFAASGTVSVSGEFVTGYNKQTKKYATIKATGSATLVPVDDGHGAVFIYLTPKGLPPHARCLNVPWPKE